MTLVCLCLDCCNGLCLFELYGDCLLLLFTLEENVAEVGEDIEVVDQEFQVQETFEQGKLPSILQLCYYFQMQYYTMVLEKELKTFSPVCEKIFCHPILLAISSTMLGW